LRVNKLVHDFSKTLCSCPPIFDCDGAPIHPAQLAQPLHQGRYALAVTCRRARNQKSEFGQLGRGLRLGGKRPRKRSAAEKRDELAAAAHVWMAPAWQEITSRAAQKSLAVMCPACSRSRDRLLALMESANRGLITRAGSKSQ